ncbi:hypothetical protein RB597_000963 [Gaeumannomyces tritici]
MRAPWLVFMWPLVGLAIWNPNRLPPSLRERTVAPPPAQVGPEAARAVSKRAEPRFLTDNTRKFAVNGTGIPNVDFDVGESYAGQLPVGSANPGASLFFWFFPSTNPRADREILIWLTGGPGCSSTGELVQENGPFLWQPGTFAPVRNRWSWHRLTNVVWIDQPVGAGFSRGNVTARDEGDVARQLMGFWRGFVDAFRLEGYRVYVTGSSYSGIYCPYVAGAMLDERDRLNANNNNNNNNNNNASGGGVGASSPGERYFDVRGMMVFDGLFSTFRTAGDAVTASFVDMWARVFAFNDTFRRGLADASDRCGYTAYVNKYLVFPAAGRQPSQPPGAAAANDGSCDLQGLAFAAAGEANPCFSVYGVREGCPRRWDPLGFAANTNAAPPRQFAGGRGRAWLDLPEVKRAIHAPDDGTAWAFCGERPVFVDDVDRSVEAGPGSLPALPGVIDRTRNVVVGHGAQDFILPVQGALLAVQNLTWGGRMGFEAAPRRPMFVPYLDTTTATTGQTQQQRQGEAVASPAGYVGTAHEERGLTWFGVAGAGHFLAQDSPGAAFRALERLLGRVDSLQSTAPFTTANNTDAVVFSEPRALAPAAQPAAVPAGDRGSMADGWRVRGGGADCGVDDGDRSRSARLGGSSGSAHPRGGVAVAAAWVVALLVGRIIL